MFDDDQTPGSPVNNNNNNNDNDNDNDNDGHHLRFFYIRRREFTSELQLVVSIKPHTHTTRDIRHHTIIITVIYKNKIYLYNKINK